MPTLVETRGVELDTSPVDDRINSFPLKTRDDARRACDVVFERTCAKAAFVDPGTTWRFMDFEGYFTLEVEVFHDAIVIQDIEITQPRDWDLGCFVVWYDGYKHLFRVPIGDGPVNYLADTRTREAAFDGRLTHLLLRLFENTAQTAHRRQLASVEFDHFFKSQGRLSNKLDRIVFEKISHSLFVTDGTRSREEIDLFMKSLSMSDLLQFRGDSDHSFLHLLESHLATTWPAALHPTLMCTELMRRTGNARAVLSDIDIGVIMGAILYGSVARRVSDASSLRHCIGAAMRSLAQGTPTAGAILAARTPMAQHVSS